MKDKLTPEQIAVLNTLAGYASFKKNFIGNALGSLPYNTICMFTGNRAGKTSTAMRDYVKRILGWHTIEKKNMRPNTPVRIIRLAAQTLPAEGGEEAGEVRNTLYPELRKWLPYEYIKQDITTRRPTIVVRDPQGGKDIIFEFVSYSQEVQSTAGVDRWSIYCDEEPPKKFWDEQLPRLITSNGDIILGLTPAEHITWTFQDLYERAEVYLRSEAVRKHIKETVNLDIRTVEKSGNKTGIAVIGAATDDNPMLDINSINEKMSGYDDPDVMAIRRYGIFKQISGTIFKDFDWKIHQIIGDKYFPEGVPDNYLHARALDYHEHVPWAITWAALSPQDECFIYNEFNPSPEKMVTYEIARVIASKSGDQKFGLNLIDPLAAKKQSNTGMSVVDDLNRYFPDLKREGLGTGGYWVPWDTKSTRGRDEIRKRLKNSKICGRPFNNAYNDEYGVKKYRPTLWVTDTCRQFALSLKNWRMEEWADSNKLVTNDPKDRPQQKYSHFPMTLEALFKNPGFSVGRFKERYVQDRPHNYFQSAFR
jgi:hypothetical protein